MFFLHVTPRQDRTSVYICSADQAKEDILPRTIQKVILFQKTPPSLRATSFFPGPRGSTPEREGSLKVVRFP